MLKTDSDWDLAALAIRRPQAQPLPLAVESPRPGEPLSIAGYGPEGTYRAVMGRCVKYHTPGGNLPHEILEVNVEARKGDSGGPICNTRGEIAGILFGAGGNLWSGYTMGSYCGRVRQFLAAAYVDFQRLPGDATMVAQAPAPAVSRIDSGRHRATFRAGSFAWAGRLSAADCGGNAGLCRGRNNHGWLCFTAGRRDLLLGGTTRAGR